MKHFAIIEALKARIPQVPGIRGAILIGSVARGDQKWNSDVDLSFWISPAFEPQKMIAEAQAIWGDRFVFGNYSAYRGHLTIYLKDLPKVDIGLYKELGGLDRNFLGSGIFEPEKAIVYDPEEVLERHLQNALDSRPSPTEWDLKSELGLLVDKFIYDFEQFSEAHRRSDAWRSHYYYNIALNSAVQITYLARGKRAYAFLPKNLSSTVLRKDELQDFYALRGSLYLPEVNAVKRRLISFVTASLRQSGAIAPARLAGIEAFLEQIYSRDFLWNFRDTAAINPALKPGILFRSSELAQYQKDKFLKEFLTARRVGRIIDLRELDEVAASPYHEELRNDLEILHIPIDPRKQSAEFIQQHCHGSNEQIAYRYFALECKAQIRQFFEALAQPKSEATIVHCHAGKDRTGVMITLIHLLSGADRKTIEMSYTASEMDTRPELLDEFLKIIDQHGGLLPYLGSCGITDQVILQVRNQLFVQN